MEKQLKSTLGKGLHSALQKLTGEKKKIVSPAKQAPKSIGNEKKVIAKAIDKKPGHAFQENEAAKKVILKKAISGNVGASGKDKK